MQNTPQTTPEHFESVLANATHTTIDLLGLLFTDEYRAMVGHLMKEPKDILQSLINTDVSKVEASPGRMGHLDATHAAIGICTESGELLMNVDEHLGIPDSNDAKKHFLEEMGDFTFYLCAYLTRRFPNGVPIVSNPRVDAMINRALAPGLTIIRPTVALVCAATEYVLGAEKKAFAYDQHFHTKYTDNAKDREKAEKVTRIAATGCIALARAFSNMCDRSGLSFLEIQEANMQKLEKSDTARYKGGYSDEAAAIRADKGDDDLSEELPPR